MDPGSLSKVYQRQQRVVVNGIALTEVTSGIPQESVLGQTLFLIYINYFPQVVHCSMKLFPDDAKMFSAVNTFGAGNQLSVGYFKSSKMVSRLVTEIQQE